MKNSETPNMNCLFVVQKVVESRPMHTCLPEILHTQSCLVTGRSSQRGNAFTCRSNMLNVALELLTYVCKAYVVNPIQYNFKRISSASHKTESLNTGRFYADNYIDYYFLFGYRHSALATCVSVHGRTCVALGMVFCARQHKIG
jgi:hypothetical protein